MGQIERDAIQPFAAIAAKLGKQHFTGQGQDNQILYSERANFQYGDLRVETSRHIIVVEVEEAGGVTNFVKYWYNAKKGVFNKPVRLLHIYARKSSNDYATHMALWDFLNTQMISDVGTLVQATRYSFPDEKQKALDDFERLVSL